MKKLSDQLLEDPSTCVFARPHLHDADSLMPEFNESASASQGIRDKLSDLWKRLTGEENLGLAEEKR